MRPIDFVIRAEKIFYLSKQIALLFKRKGFQFSSDLGSLLLNIVIHDIPYSICNYMLVTETHAFLLIYMHTYYTNIGHVLYTSDMIQFKDQLINNQCVLISGTLNHNRVSISQFEKDFPGKSEKGYLGQNRLFAKKYVNNFCYILWLLLFCPYLKRVRSVSNWYINHVCMACKI